MAKRRLPQQLLRDELSWLKFGLLRLYSGDQEFRKSLTEFYERCCRLNEVLVANNPDLRRFDRLRLSGNDRSRWADGYLHRLAELARRFGLDRLGAKDPERKSEYEPSEGEQAIQLWCSRKAWEGTTDRARILPERFAIVAGQPGFGDTAWPEQEELWPEAVLRLHAAVEGTWAPDRESRKGAMQRFMEMAALVIDAELERIVQAQMATGWESYTSTNVGRDVIWLFLKLRYRWSYGEIGTRWGTKAIPAEVFRHVHVRIPERQLEPLISRPDQIQRRVGTAVRRMADRIGISRTGW